MATVNMHEAKSNLSKLVEAVETGEQQEVIIARNGKPVARIVPLEGRAMYAHEVTSRLGIAAGRFPARSFEELQDGDDDIARQMTEGSLFPAAKDRQERTKKLA